MEDGQEKYFQCFPVGGRAFHWLQAKLFIFSNLPGAYVLHSSMTTHMVRRVLMQQGTCGVLLCGLNSAGPLKPEFK